MTMVTPDCASNQLARGEAQDIRHALLLVLREYQDEIDFIDGTTPDLPPHVRDILPAMLHARADLTQQIALVKQCLREYDAALASVEQTLFHRWAASDDEEVRRLGEAALANDFAALAI
jgi:hypothetical protein